MTIIKQHTRTPAMLDRHAIDQACRRSAWRSINSSSIIARDIARSLSGRVVHNCTAY